MEETERCEGVSCGKTLIKEAQMRIAPEVSALAAGTTDVAAKYRPEREPLEADVFTPIMAS
jgi:hypothetical protein